LTEESNFLIRFWGVRGSIACPGEMHQRYGGNTSCIEVRCGDRTLIFDAGTGLRALGNAMMAGGSDKEADIFLTHTHHDHIAGFPFFSPFFQNDYRIRIWAGHLQAPQSLHQVLCQYMAAPLFPVPPQHFSADLNYRDFKGGETLTPYEGVSLRTASLNHPNGATGYRIEFDGRSVCYVTDTEHIPGAPDQNILSLIAGADLLIYDSTYTDAEFPNFVNWGHSTWQEGVRLSDQAGVKTLVIFHHDPSHTDDHMDQISEEAEKARAGTVVAREGMVLSP
jgi:phosphoribosyl 1,2-cyclic phosphodiesterase